MKGEILSLRDTRDRLDAAETPSPSGDDFGAPETAPTRGVLSGGQVCARSERQHPCGTTHQHDKNGVATLPRPKARESRDWDTLHQVYAIGERSSGRSSCRAAILSR